MPTTRTYRLALMHRFDPSENDFATETSGKRLIKMTAKLCLHGIRMDSDSRHADTFRLPA